jgi:acetyl esterase/lipase
MDLGNVAPADIKINVQLTDTPPRTHGYKRVGDLEIKLDVYRLLGDDVRPALIWIHGGALITGQRTGINPEQRRRYLDAGFVVVAIDYRLAPETKLAGIIDDLNDAFKWVRENGMHQHRIDPKRVGVVGHSAGGYLTLMSGFAIEPRPKALVSFYGYGDIAGDWYAKPDPFYRKTRPLVSKEDAYKAVGKSEIAEGNVKGRGDFYMYCRQNGLWPQLVTGHDPAKEPRAFDRFCPIRNVTTSYPPTLLLHGDNDTDVPYQQSVDMANELKKQGVTHELITIKNGPHGFDGKGFKDAEVASAFERTLAFLKKHVP